MGTTDARTGGRGRAWALVVAGLVLAVAGFVALSADGGSWDALATIAMVLGAGVAVRGLQLVGRTRR